VNQVLDEVRAGQLASFTTPTWGERRFQGRVHSINPMVDAQSRSVKVILNISNPGEELRSGMFARGEIESAARCPCPRHFRDRRS
jgi:multidrug efflux pump subunit AcrA (membrane-fusion protein)